MKIEDMTLDSLKASLAKATSAEIKNYRYRFICVFSKYFKDNQTSEVLIKSMGETLAFTRLDLYRKYMLVESEMKKRGIEFRSTLLDKAVFRRKLKGLGIDTIGDITVLKEAVCITGDFVKTRNDQSGLEISIRALGEANTERLLGEITKRFEMETKQAPETVVFTKSLTDPYIPVYDLKLVPRTLLEIKEPQDKEPDEVQKYDCQYCGADAIWAYTFNKGKEFIPVCHKHRMKARNEFLGDRSTECIVKSIKKIAVTAEPKKKKTLEIKLIEKEEHALEDYLYLLHHIAVDDKGEEEIHHCFLYDHIGNLFTQGHVVIKNGKAFLDGKKAKDGVYHVITGLEETQEIAWSEKEAIEAGIKPKPMEAGMTFKEKAKVWK